MFARSLRSLRGLRSLTAFGASLVLASGALLAVPTPAHAAPDWQALGLGFDDVVTAVVTDSQGNIVVGGDFTSSGTTSLYSPAIWDGSSWSSIGGGIAAEVSALAFDSHGNLYVGGSFSGAGGVANTANLAMWDGSAWHSVGGGTNGDNGGNGGRVNALAIDSSDRVYVGGEFSTVGVSGVTPANGIAVWDGSAWSSAMGAGVQNSGSPATPGDVYALALTAAGWLYVGGEFDTAGGSSSENIALFAGGTWSGIFHSVQHGGTNGYVSSLAVAADGSLYVGGDFTDAGGSPASRIAKFSGSWSALGSGLDNEGRALAIDSAGNVYAGGWFNNAGGVAVDSVAMWDGSAWSALGNGVSGDIYALAYAPRYGIVAGGYFNSPADNIAVWTLSGTGPSGSTAEGGPAPVIQQVGRLADERCENPDDPRFADIVGPKGGWRPSWAQWANAGQGGPVCTRELYFDSGVQTWLVRR